MLSGVSILRMEEVQEPALGGPAEATPAPSETPVSNLTSTSSTSSTVPVRPSGLPKPSGLKPPSKIGRLCSNSAPKPAVPISPRTGE